MDDAATEIAITSLKRRYFHGVDAKDWNMFGDVFSPDATLSISDPQVPLIRGRDEIVHQVSHRMEGITSIHRGFLRVIEFPTPDIAQAIWAMEDILLRPKNGALHKILHGYGHYHEEYHNDGTAWKYRSVNLKRTYVETFD